jgi:hypothetical protein
MATTVEVAFELTVGDLPYFRLNDPVKGRLNNVTYRLSGPIFIDVTDQVASVSIARGKNRELDRYSSGQATVMLHNENRFFDPLNESSPYAGNIIPRREVRVRTNGVSQFTGLIEDWNLDYEVSGKSDAIIQCADAFTLLAQQRLVAGTATPETTGERMNVVLSMPTVAWPLTQRNVATGSSELGDDVFEASVSALEYLQKVEASEQGQFFIAKDGYVTFVPGTISPTSAASKGRFSDAGDGIPYTQAAVSYGTELLYNSVTVSAPISEQSWDNIDSQLKYGITTTDVDTLLGNPASVLALAQFWVAKYGEPEYRFESLSVQLDGLDAEQTSTVLDIELGDIVEVAFTPNGIGSPIDRFGQVTKIEHSIAADRHSITFGFASLQFSFLILDDEGFGILDEYVLAF